MSLPTLTCAVRVLEHSDFMPFASPTPPTLKLIAAQPELDEQQLEGLLFGHFVGKEQWLREAREVLWGSDRVRQVSVPQLLSDHSANTVHKCKYYGNLFMYNIYIVQDTINFPF